MDYLLARAKQHLNVYFVKVKTEQIESDGTKNIVYTFSLQGKKLATPQNYFKILCRKTKVYDKNLPVLE